LYVNDHLTQAQLAAELGISQSQVSRELAILKKKWRTICRSILQESLQDALLILDEASQYYRQNYHHSVEHAHSPELRDVGEASPEGKIETRKSTRVRRVKPYSDRSVDGLVKVSKEIVRVTELLQQENAKYPDPDPFAGLTHEERADVLGQMLAAAFERALKKVPVATSESPGGDGKGADSTFDPDPAEDNGIAEPSMAERLAAPICDLLC
jgi:transcriptional regulator with XRE-family HTH domain